MVAKTDEVESWLHPKNTQFLELARVPHHALFVTLNNIPPRLQSIGPMSIVLALNKESMVLDPIDWPRFKDDLLE